MKTILALLLSSTVGLSAYAGMDSCPQAVNCVADNYGDLICGMSRYDSEWGFYTTPPEKFEVGVYEFAKAQYFGPHSVEPVHCIYHKNNGKIIILENEIHNSGAHALKPLPSSLWKNNGGENQECTANRNPQYCMLSFTGN